jgi:hypothetical protein
MWVWLRPGLCLADVQDRAEEIAAACWATAVVADLASASNSALVRIDIKRRDPLTGTVASPLAQLLSGVIPGRRLAVAPDPVALDLPDIDPAEVSGNPDRTGRPSWPDQPRRRPQQPAAAAGNDEEGDLNDWI